MEAELFVKREDFKFNAAHFVVHEGGRERLHGHNYTAAIKVEGCIGEDGYVIDFGEIKKVMRTICRNLHECFLCPMKSPWVKATTSSDGVEVVVNDGSRFVFPLGDCILLPIRNTTVEELGVYLLDMFVETVGEKYLRERQVTRVGVGVAEVPNQEAWVWKDWRKK